MTHEEALAIVSAIKHLADAVTWDFGCLILAIIGLAMTGWRK